MGFLISKRFLHKIAAALLATVLLATALCGCGDTVQGKDQDKGSSGISETDDAEISVQTTYPVGTYERKAADRAASGDSDSDGEVLDFGSESIFGGIQIETDENGELVCNAEDGALWYKITDKRFPSYYSFTRFIKKKSGKKAGAAEVEKLSRYFGERNGALYFVDGARGRTVKDQSRYFLDDASRLTVDVIHTDECARKYKLAFSRIHFVRDSKNKSLWKLDSLVLYEG